MIRQTMKEDSNQETKLSTMVKRKESEKQNESQILVATVASDERGGWPSSPFGWRLKPVSSGETAPECY